MSLKAGILHGNDESILVTFIMVGVPFVGRGNKYRPVAQIKQCLLFIKCHTQISSPPLADS